MDIERAVYTLLIGVLGFFCSLMWQRYRELEDHKLVGKAVRSLREKGFTVEFDRLEGYDTDTQIEMERVRSVGYTVIDKNGASVFKKTHSK